MKKLLLLLFCLPLFAFAQQLSIKDIRLIPDMDSETFEIFCMKRDYEFYQLEKDDNRNGLTMKYFDGVTTRYISWYSEYFGVKKGVNYQTTSTAELLSIYEELKSLGFKLISREKNESENLRKMYENSNTEEVIIMFLSDDMTEIGYIIY